MRSTVLGFVLLAIFAQTAANACERFARAEDLVVEVGSEGIRVVIVNTTDRCSLVFADNLKTAPGKEDEPPNMVAVRVDAPDGQLLSTWFVQGGLEPHRILDFTLSRLPPGQTRVKRYEFHRMLSGIDSHLKAAGHAPLPWGSTVVLRVTAGLIIDPEAAAGRVGGDVKTVDVETVRFLYALPKEPL